LLIVATLLSIVLGVLANRLIDARNQFEVVRRVKNAGGWSYYCVPYELHVGCGEANSFSFQSVQHIELGGLKNTDEELKLLSLLPRLKSLEVWSKFSDEGVASIARISNLEHLSFSTKSGATVTKGLSQFGNLPRLKMLKLVGKRFDDDLLASLGEMPRVHALTLTDTGITSAGLALLRNFPNLNLLTLERNANLDRDCLSHIAQLQRLEHLTISQSLADSTDLNQLAKLKSLRTFHLSGLENYKDKEIDFLKDLPQLQMVWIFNCPITDDGVRQLIELPELKNLALSSTQITDACGTEIAKMPKLERLSFHNSKITITGLRAACSAKRLKHLQIDADLSHEEEQILRQANPQVHVVERP